MERASTPARRPEQVRIAIVGSGFGGLGAAIRLKQQGERDFVILERAADLGGTWRDNGYPGCACDVESHLYSFSFALNPDWSRSFSPRGEIWDYLRSCAERAGLQPHIRFGHEVREARWDEAAQRWAIETALGDFQAGILVMASGALSDPVVPRIRGLERFRGEAFHSARWNHSFDLRGKRVAVVGTGASAIQFVPAIQPLVGRLHLFQRTPAWVLPRNDRARSRAARWLTRHVPGLQRLLRAFIYARRELLLLAFQHPRLARIAERAALAHLRKGVGDAELRRKLTPGFTLGCKRVLLSNDYFPAVARPNVELVTEEIAEVRERSIVDGAGTERPVDAIIFGTGFQPTSPPLARHVFGRGGTKLSEAWSPSPSAHLGTSVVGFPNLFVLLGPNTGLGHTSVIYMIEAQVEHFLEVLRLMRKDGIRAIEPSPEAQARFVAQVDRRMSGTVWVAGGCASWYLDSSGRNSTLWPDFTWRFRRRALRVDAGDFVVQGALPEGRVSA